MPEPITPAPPAADKPIEPKAPVTAPGQAPTADELPEKFKGKSASDIAKSYLELEKEHGKHTEEVKKTREENEQWKALGQVIGNNPALKKAVQDEIDHITKPKTEDKKEDKETPKRDDVRIAAQDQIINKFEEDRGLRLIPAEKKTELDKAIGRELVDMLDPTGTKTPSEIIASIPVDRLPKYLDKAYLLATAGDKEERTRSQEFVEAKRNQAATIGSMPSSGVRESDFNLTPGEKEAARRMNISEEDYIKQKKEMAKE